MDRRAQNVSEGQSCEDSRRSKQRMIHCGVNYPSLITPQILDSPYCTGGSSRRCLRLLRKICSSWMVLPPTYVLSGKLSVPATQPVAFGGFSDIFKGTLSGESVCVKRLRISTTGDLVAVKQVTAFHAFQLSNPDKSPRHFARRPWCGNVSTT